MSIKEKKNSKEKKPLLNDLKNNNTKIKLKTNKSRYDVAKVWLLQIRFFI
jgi:hypothetical protein